MAANIRFNFDISSNGYQFRELVLQGRSQGAIETLQKIECILKEQKPYIPLQRDDPFALQDARRQHLCLQKIARTITDNYLTKARAILCFNEMTNPTYQKIKALCLRIDNLVDPPKVFPELTYELHSEICEQIPMTYRTIARLNRTGLKLAKAYVLIKARRFAYKGQSVSGALKYIHQLETEGRELVKEGFLLPARMRSLQDLHHYLSPQNKKAESLLHFAASKGLLKVIDYAIAFFPSLINRKLFGKTAVQLASEQGNTKVMRRLMEKGADMEGSFPATIYLNSSLLDDIFSHLTTPQDLLAVGSVSKAWHMISKENRLWERVYQKFFPKANSTSSKVKPSRYWESKFMRFYRNAFNGFYVEELIPRDFLTTTKNIILAGNFLFFSRTYAPPMGELWTTVSGKPHLIRKIFDLTPQGVPPHTVNNVFLTCSFLIITAGEHVRYILNENGKHFDIRYPCKVLNYHGRGDRAIAQLEDDTLHVVSPQNQNNKIDDYQISLPPLFQQNSPRSVAANDQWIALQDGGEIILLKNNQDGKPEIFNQKLELLAGNIFSKLVFSNTCDGTLILIAEAFNEDDSGFSIWSFDEARKHWILAVDMKDMRMLGQEGDFLFLTNFFRTQKWDKSLHSGIVARNIYSYKWNGELFEEVCQFRDPIQIIINGNKPPNPRSLEHLLEEHYSFSVKNGLLAATDKLSKEDLPGNLSIFDGRHKDSRYKRLARGTIDDLGEDMRSKYGKVDGVLGKWTLFNQWKPLLIFSEKLTLVGFTMDGSLVLNDERRGIIIRRFDVTSEEILKDIAQIFQNCFLLNHFLDVASCSHVADIYNRFRRFDIDTQKEIWRHLYNKIKGTQWNYTLTFDDGEKIAQDAFFGNKNRLTNGLRISKAILNYIKKTLHEEKQIDSYGRRLVTIQISPNRYETRVAEVQIFGTLS